MKKVLGFLIVTLLIIGTAKISNAAIINITPEFGNGPYADGDIPRNLLGAVYTPRFDSSLAVGDDSAPTDLERIYRSFIGFDLSSLDGYQVVNATFYLSCHQGSANIGSVLVDIVDFGSSLDIGDYDITPLQSNIGAFSAIQVAYQSLDVTNAVISALSSEMIQFRLRAEIEESMTGQNIAMFNNVEDYKNNGEIPMLSIEVNAVPIPSAIWLLGSGLIGLVGFRRKIRKV